MDVPRAPGLAGSPVVAHYAAGQEAGRLDRGVGQLEAARTRELLERYLPPPPARVADVGGGPGGHAVWLAGRGYTVDLLDLVPLHVEQARRRFEAPGLGGARALVGDARALPYAPASQDAALLLGPLYHLPARSDRLTALREAWRVLRPGGVVVAATISRFAPRGTYRELGGLEVPGEDPEGVWSVVCFFVARRYRGQGLMRRLLEEGIARARARGAKVIEAYPVDPDSPSYRFMGFVPFFEAAGFREVGRAGSRRHVLRLELG